jgi:hypothetical protein
VSEQLVFEAGAGRGRIRELHHRLHRFAHLVVRYADDCDVGHGRVRR